MTAETMMAELRDAGIAFDEDKDVTGLWLNVNDVFVYAADAELVEEADIPTVYTIWKKHGASGVIDWVATKRGEMPIRREGK